MEKFIQNLQKDFIIKRIPSCSGIFIDVEDSEHNDVSLAFLNTKQMTLAFRSDHYNNCKKETKMLKEVITKFYGL